MIQESIIWLLCTLLCVLFIRKSAHLKMLEIFLRRCTDLEYVCMMPDANRVILFEELYIMLDNFTFHHANKNILLLTSDVCTRILNMKWYLQVFYNEELTMWQDQRFEKFV